LKVDQSGADLADVRP